MYRLGLIVIAAFTLAAQVVAPKPKVQEYEVRAKAAKAEFGGEFMVHIVSAEGKSHFIPEYFCVELAVYPEKGTTLQLARKDFTLRINGKKPELPTESPGLVAISLNTSGWSQRQPESGQPATASEAVVSAGLNEGEVDHPIAGYLYFPYRGDGKKAKTIELIYRGPAGEVTLPLR
jgi:hypothetical protein